MNQYWSFSMKTTLQGKKNYETNETVLKPFDVTWSWDLLDMIDYGSSNDNGYRYFPVVVDNCPKFGWCIPLKKIYAQTIKDEFFETVRISKRKSNLIETNVGEEFVNEFFNDFSELNDIKRYSRYSSKEVVFAESYDRTLKIFLNKPVFEEGNAN